MFVYEKVSSMINAYFFWTPGIEYMEMPSPNVTHVVYYTRVATKILGRFLEGA